MATVVGCWRLPQDLVRRGRWEYLCLTADLGIFASKNFIRGAGAGVVALPERVCRPITWVDARMYTGPGDLVEDVGIPCRLGMGWLVLDPETGEYRLAEDPALGAEAVTSVDALLSILAGASILTGASGEPLYVYSAILGPKKAYPAPLPLLPQQWENLVAVAPQDLMNSFMSGCRSWTLTAEIAKAAYAPFEDAYLNIYMYGDGVWNAIVALKVPGDGAALAYAKRWWGCYTKLVKASEALKEIAISALTRLPGEV